MGKRLDRLLFPPLLQILFIPFILSKFWKAMEKTGVVIGGDCL